MSKSGKKASEVKKTKTEKKPTTQKVKPTTVTKIAKPTKVDAVKTKPKKAGIQKPKTVVSAGTAGIKKKRRKVKNQIKPETKAKQRKLKDSPLYIPRSKNFGVGRDIQPKRDLTRFVKWPKYIRIQRQKRILIQRLKIPGTINQFNYTADKNTSHALFKLLKKYQPETRKQRSRRLKATAKLIFAARKDKEKQKKLLAAKSEKRATKLAAKRVKRDARSQRKAEKRKVKDKKDKAEDTKRKEIRKQKKKELGPKKRTPTTKKVGPPRELLLWKKANLKLKHENKEKYKAELKAKKDRNSQDKSRRIEENSRKRKKKIESGTRQRRTKTS